MAMLIQKDVPENRIDNTWPEITLPHIKNDMMRLPSLILNLHETGLIARLFKNTRPNF